MALRPFSLLLLLVMIPAITMLDSQDFDEHVECHKPNWFCYTLTSDDETRNPILKTTGSAENEIGRGGIAIDTTKPHEWTIVFDYYFDWHIDSDDDKCQIKLYPVGPSKAIPCNAIIKSRDIEDFRGIKIVPYRYNKEKKIIELKLKVDSGLYISDALELYINPWMALGVIKLNKKKNTIWNDGTTDTSTEQFKPFSCYVGNYGAKPQDAGVAKVSQEDNKFSCSSADHYIYLSGARTTVKELYCTQGGWRDLNKNYVLQEQADVKQMPYCWKDTMFEDCTKNKCFVFGDGSSRPLNNLKIEGDRTKAIGKLGVYVDYINDKQWIIELAYIDKKLETFSIGKETFTIGTNKFSDVIQGQKATATIIRDGPTLESKITGKRFRIEAKSDEPKKELMEVLGFYSGDTNQLKLMFTGIPSIEVKGVANFKKYVKTSTYVFPGPGATLLKDTDIDVDNAFECKNKQGLFVDGKFFNMQKIRFTAQGWRYYHTGEIQIGFQKDAAGKEIIQGVYCYVVCHIDAMTLTGTPVPTKLAGNTFEYSCAGDYVKVGTGNYDKISCKDNQWTGDGKVIPFSTDFVLAAECYGVSKLYKTTCSTADTNAGCGQLKNTGGVLTCDPGFALTIEGSADTNKIYKSLKLNKEGKWMEEGTVGIPALPAHKASCISKCAPNFVTVETAKADSGNALKSYDSATKTLTVKCSGSDVLVTTLEGAEKQHIKDLTCDQDGWKEGTDKKKDFNGIVNIDNLKVSAYCYKACDEQRLTKPVCPTTYAATDCGTSSYKASTNTLSCPDGTVLYVNDQLVDKELVCSREGWTKKGETSLFIDHKSAIRPAINVQCFAKCGKKFVTGDAPLSGSKIVCGGTSMIRYQVNGGDPWDTLEDLTCDKTTGWKAGPTSIAVFTGPPPTIAAKCQPSCVESLFKPNCAGRSSGCEKVKFAADQMTCNGGLHLWAEGNVDSKMQCTKKAFETTEPSGLKNIFIARTKPSQEAQISCISKCDNLLIVTADASDAIAKAAETAGKLSAPTEENGKYIVECKDELHYTTITHEATTVYTANKWTCDRMQGWTDDDVTYKLDFIDGKPIKKGCHNMCLGRVKDCGTSCKKPDEAGNKLDCGKTHVLRKTISATHTEDFVPGELACRKDGFYHNDKRVLDFKAKPDDDVNEKFDVSCISKCDVKFVENVGQAKGLDDSVFFPIFVRPQPTDALKCTQPDQLLFLHSPIERRVFGDATCKEDVGWSVKKAVKDPATGVWTESAEAETIVDFAQSKSIDEVKIKASCVKVCDAKMVFDTCADPTTAEENKDPKFCDNIMQYTGANSELKCKPHHRLYLDGKKSDDATATNKMKCTKEGWKDGTESIIDFRDSLAVIPKIHDVLCKHKCHKDFIDFSIESCTKTTNCSKATYDDKKLTCAGPTEILVLEHEGKKRESWDFAACSDAGWKDKDGGEMFKLDGLNYHVKARCEELCSPNVDNGEPIVNSQGLPQHNYTPENKNLTCVDNNLMLKFDGKGVYSDLICSKEGWRLPKKEVVDGKETEKLIPGDVKFAFTPITDDTIKQTEEMERAKKFTCELNDCMRPKHCATSKAACTDPDITSVKYSMSCTSPDQLIKLSSTQAGQTGIYYSDVICDGGKWIQKSASQEPVVAPLEDPTKPIDERPVLPVICTSDTCAKCEKTLKQIESGTDTNIVAAVFKKGEYVSCSRYECENHHFVTQDQNKNKYYYNDPGRKSVIKCAAKDDSTKNLFDAPDGASNVVGNIGCVKQIPCFEHSRIKTDCEDNKCDNNFAEMLKEGSKMNGTNPPPDLKCGELGEMFHEMADTDGKKAWNKVENLKCTERGEWKATVLTGKKGDTATEKILTAQKDDADPAWRVVCSLYKLIPDPEDKGYNPKTQTCSLCPTLEDLKCKGCDVTAKQGDGECTMTTIGRFKFNGKEETKKLICKNVNGEYKYLSAEGRRVDSLSVIPPSDISTGAIVGIVFGVILLLGSIVFAMVFVTIRRKRERERLERLKSKGLEQKQDTIIDNATIIDDTKTLVL